MGFIIIGSPQVVYNHYTNNKTFINTAYYKIKKQYKDNKVFINFKNPKQKKHYQQLIAPFNINETIQHIYCQCTANYIPILYSIDINGIGNYIKVWNEANGKGANNNSWDNVGDNSEDNNNREDDNNEEDISGVRI